MISGLESLVGNETQHLSENYWIWHYLSLSIGRIKLAPLPSIEAFHFVQHACKHQWRVSETSNNFLEMKRWRKKDLD